MFEKYTFIIGEHFLSALINDDWTGLNDGESIQLETFLTDIWLELEAGADASHWSYDEDQSEFRHCDVTGQRGMCVHVDLMVRHARAA